MFFQTQNNDMHNKFRGSFLRLAAAAAAAAGPHCSDYSFLLFL
jgi:hypothetical protein